TASACIINPVWFRLVRVRDLQKQLAEQKEQSTTQVTSLEKQVLEAQKSQLERALARARSKVGLEEVLDSLIRALAEVEERNFGRALQKIEAANGALNEASGAAAPVRDAIGAELDEIKAGLNQLDIRVREKIIALSASLEEGPVPGSGTE
ncbi:hypothetical protein ACFL0Q_08600, partial [Thermodesulfobacteriota bacterium]